MNYITRKTLLYKSGLGFYCINHVQGCSHGCRYPCYAYMMAHTHGRSGSMEEWRTPALVENAADLLEKELQRMRNKPENIHLCLTTDPFMHGFPEVTKVSLKLISIINSYGISCSLLTKGLLPAGLADTSLFSPSNQAGISLISINEDFRKKWEPGAANYEERILALKYLHQKGCNTYVHMEPYPTPNIIDQDLTDILDKVKFANQIYFSGWNYNSIVKQFPDYLKFYREQTDVVRRFCVSNNISFSS